MDTLTPMPRRSLSGMTVESIVFDTGLGSSSPYPEFMMEPGTSIANKSARPWSFSLFAITTGITKSRTTCQDSAHWRGWWWRYHWWGGWWWRYHRGGGRRLILYLILIGNIIYFIPKIPNTLYYIKYIIIFFYKKFLNII